METSVSQALFWMWLRPQSRGHQLESSCAEEPLAAAPGDREPRQGREQGKGLKLGHRRRWLLHELCVLKG